MKSTLLSHSAKIAFACAVATVFFGGVLFLSLEPTIGRTATFATTTDEFLITQTITGEISFAALTPDVTMAGAINGITGGNSTGTTYAVVRTNSVTGYTMDISFSNSPAMRGNVSTSTAIRNYVGVSGEPQFAFTASSAALFAYTVSASNTTDLDRSFLDNGSVCDSIGGSDTADACWMGNTGTSTFRIINRGSAADTGATTSIKFRINVPNNPSPAVAADTYTATATLTATNQ
jgi:hypothetical protein